MARATWVNAKYKSINEGLDELQMHFLGQELRKNHSRPTSALRSIAKVRAFKQRVKWIFQEVMMVTGLLISILFVVVALIVSQL